MIAVAQNLIIAKMWSDESVIITYEYSDALWCFWLLAHNIKSLRYVLVSVLSCGMFNHYDIESLIYVLVSVLSCGMFNHYDIVTDICIS